MISIIEGWRQALLRTSASLIPSTGEVLVADPTKKDVSDQRVLRVRLPIFLQRLASAASAAFSIGYGIFSTSATAGIGYAAGAGGTVTQGTDKSTAVELNKVTGAITMNNAELADATNVTFTVTNSACAANDVPLVTHKSGGTLGAYHVDAHSPAAGSFKITIRNRSGGALSEALVIQFVIFKGAVA